MRIATNALSVSDNISGYMDAMDRHHEIREFTLGLLDAVGTPIALVTVIDVSGDEFFGRDSRAAANTGNAFGYEISDAFTFREQMIDASFLFGRLLKLP